MIHFFNEILEYYSWQGIALMAVVVILFMTQLYYYLIAYYRIYRFRLMRRRAKLNENPPISVIVALRGESERFLTTELPALLQQQYNHYEIVVVYIGGDMEYYEELQRIRDNYSYMRLTRMGGSNERFYISTKQALNVGIKSAQYECLLFTIPGATPLTKDWISTMAKGFERGSVVIAPAVPVFESKNLSTYIMRLVEFNLMRNAMACAVVGKPYYAPRSNYGFDRKLYDAKRGYNYLGIDIGENDLFMHGTMPRSLAPRQQFEIPFIVWENDSATRTKELENVRQFYVFHTVMNWFGMQGPVYNEEMNLFEPVE